MFQMGMNELQGSLLITKSHLLNPLLFFFAILSKFVRCFDINPSSIPCKWTKSKNKNWMSEGYSWSTNTCIVAQWIDIPISVFFPNLLQQHLLALAVYSKQTSTPVHPRRASTSKSVKNWTKPFWASLWASAKGKTPATPGPSSGLMIVSCNHFENVKQYLIEMYIYMGYYENVFSQKVQ